MNALGDLAKRLSESEQAARIRLVGGAALSIAYYDRRSTRDVDALISPAVPVLEVAQQIARERGWQDDWPNDAATMFLPLGGERRWDPVVREGAVIVEVASAEMLLVMKLNAGRGRRDSDDIEYLLDHCEVTTVEEAVDLFALYYPGEVMKPRALEQVRQKFEGSTSGRDG